MKKSVIAKILGKEIVCSISELERRICEVGPGDKRCEPIDLVDSFQEMALTQEAKPILIESSIDDFYTLDKMPKELSVLIMTLKKRLYQRTLDAINADLNAPVQMFQKLFVEAGGVISSEAIRNDKEDWPNFKGFLQKESKEYYVQITLFNLRLWLYPFSWRIWKVVYDSLKQGNYPVILSRQIAKSTFMLFRATKMIGYQLYKQYCAPDAYKSIGNPPLIFLGFTDMASTANREERYKRFFSDILGSYLKKNYETFSMQLPNLLKYAEILQDQELRGEKRLAKFRKFLTYLSDSEEKVFLIEFSNRMSLLFESNNIYTQSILNKL